jgi:hypothetical protein
MYPERRRRRMSVIMKSCIDAVVKVSRKYSKDNEKQGQVIHHLLENLASLEAKITSHNAIFVPYAQLTVSRPSFVVDTELTRVAHPFRSQL